MDRFFTLDSLNLLRNTAFYLLIVTVMIGFLRFRSLTRAQRYIVLIVALTFLSDALTMYLAKQNVHSLWVFHFFVPLMFILLLFTYEQQLRWFRERRVLVIFIISVVLLNVLNSLFLQGLDEFNSYAVSFSSFTYVVFSIGYFHKLLKNPAEQSLDQVPMFWFNIGVLVYYSGTFLLYSVVDNLLELPIDVVISAWVLNMVFYNIFIVFMSISLCLKLRK